MFIEFEHLVGGKVVHPDHHVLAEIAEAAWQPREGGIGDGLELGEARRLTLAPFAAAHQAPSSALSYSSIGAYIRRWERQERVSMTRKHSLLSFGLAWLLGILAVPAPASAKDCAAWNNWCRPACGDWNGYCAGQSLPQVISRMSPRSYFADPWWYGQRVRHAVSGAAMAGQGAEETGAQGQELKG